MSKCDQANFHYTSWEIQEKTEAVQTEATEMIESNPGASDQRKCANRSEGNELNWPWKKDYITGKQHPTS